jgi:general secretion pathway protein A
VYESYFHFSSKPFAMNPDPEFLYPSRQHAAALTMLEYAIESQAPFCLLTGEIGSGKTTLLRHFLRQLGDKITVGLIVPHDDSDIAQYEALIDFFVHEYGRGRRTLMIVDEAHNLTPGILEELRLLSNVNSERDLSLQVLLVGQPELRTKLNHPDLEQFAQRVSVDFHLGPLTLQEASAYVQHRLAVAGGDPSIFDAEAIAFVHSRTRGVPRLINQLCDLALVYAFAGQQRAIDVQLLQHVLQDRTQGGAIPLFGGASAAKLRIAVDAADLSSERG